MMICSDRNVNEAINIISDRLSKLWIACEMVRAYERDPETRSEFMNSHDYALEGLMEDVIERIVDILNKDRLSGGTGQDVLVMAGKSGSILCLDGRRYICTYGNSHKAMWQALGLPRDLSNPARIKSSWLDGKGVDTVCGECEACLKDFLSLPLDRFVKKHTVIKNAERIEEMLVNNWAGFKTETAVNGGTATVKFCRNPAHDYRVLDFISKNRGVQVAVRQNGTDGNLLYAGDEPVYGWYLSADYAAGGGRWKCTDVRLVLELDGGSTVNVTSVPIKSGERLGEIFEESILPVQSMQQPSRTQGKGIRSFFKKSYAREA